MDTRSVYIFMLALSLMLPIPAAQAQSAAATLSALEALESEQGDSLVRDLARRAEAGDADAQYWLGRYLHDIAPLTRRDFAQGRAWLQRASDAGHPRATDMLARIHEIGFIVPSDHDAAIRYYARAVELGSATAGHDIARIEFAREQRDTGRIVEYLTIAAERGHRPSIIDLGFLFAAGTLGEVDGEAAAHWAQRGVALGEPRSMNLLARLHANGLGVEANAVEALKWAILARDLGDADGAEIARQIAEAVPEEVQQEARARALAWREANSP